MAQFEHEALPQKQVIESILGYQREPDGTFTVVAKQRFPRKKDQEIKMRFTHSGMAAIVGTLRFLLGEVNKDVEQGS
ncbi:hypothetical protein [Secundilactobacillus kimchicus]|uniref:hypothetical protein n=1 Tax=Secundilactobacillus kimchicus TaxID=528209 RepID=UPI0024A7C34C|nr:hypothetical protein [Secundilactobacillus kimchicus]